MQLLRAAQTPYVFITGSSIRQHWVRLKYIQEFVFDINLFVIKVAQQIGGERIIEKTVLGQSACLENEEGERE